MVSFVKFSNGNNPWINISTHGKNSFDLILSYLSLVGIILKFSYYYWFIDGYNIHSHI